MTIAWTPVKRKSLPRVEIHSLKPRACARLHLPPKVDFSYPSSPTTLKPIGRQPQGRTGEEIDERVE